MSPFLLRLLRFCLCLLLPAYAWAGEVVTPKRVLLLSSVNEIEPWGLALSQSLGAKLAALPFPTELYVEKTIADPAAIGLANDDALVAYLKAKYVRRRPDLIISSDEASTMFLHARRGQLFPGAPIVYVASRRLLEEQESALGTAHFLADPADPLATMRLIRQLLPEVEELVIVGDTPGAGRSFTQSSLETIRGEFAHVRDLRSATLEELMQTLPTLTRRSAVFLYPWVRSAHGHVLAPVDMLKQVVPATPVPIFSFVDFYLDYGVVGGKMIRGEARGAAMGELAGQLLQRAADAPPPTPPTVTQPLMFNYAALQRFGLADLKLPPGSIVLHKPLPLSATNPAAYYGGIAVIAVLSVFVLMLLRAARRRRQYAATLREQAQHLRQIIDAMPHPTVVIDAWHTVTQWNRAAEATTGIQREAIARDRAAMDSFFAGRRKLLADFAVDQASEAEILAYYRQMGHDQAQLSRSEAIPDALQMLTKITLKGERTAWIQSISRPLRNADGAIVGAVQSTLDLTEIMATREALERLNQDLESRVAERTRELAQAHDELNRAMAQLVQREKLSALGNLVAGVAHELNTPLGTALTVVTTFADAIGRFLGQTRAGQLKKSELESFLGTAGDAAAMLERNIRRAGELVGSFKSIAIDHADIRRHRFVLDRLVAESVRALSPGYAQHSLRIVQQIPPEIELDSYPAPLEQILTNLLNNAVTHAQGDHATLTVRISAESVGDEPLGTVVLRVADDGIGMDEAVKKRIFDPFFTTRFGQGGIGLGLYVVYNLATTVLGATLDVQSTPGAGTCFTLYLPRIAPELPAADKESPP